MDFEVQETKTLHDIEMQEVNDQSDIDIDYVDTGMERTVEKTLTQE